MEKKLNSFLMENQEVGIIYAVADRYRFSVPAFFIDIFEIIDTFFTMLIWSSVKKIGAILFDM